MWAESVRAYEEKHCDRPLWCVIRLVYDEEGRGDTYWLNVRG
jgi:hypothetical protein